MARPTFYTKPSCTTCRNAKAFLDTAGIEVTVIDIDKTPPTREFLEQHIDAEHFLDFVSTRSPVFKQRPLPASKQEAIALMMENSNLIKRPVVVKGTKTIFGFDKVQYGTL